MSKAADHPPLNVKSVGSGPTMLMVHGFGANNGTWRHVEQTLAKDFRLVMVELAGFGASRPPVGFDFAVESQVRLLQETLDCLDIRPDIAMGHSMGGGILLAAAVMGAVNSKRLVLIDPLAIRQAPPFFIAVHQLPFVARIGMSLLPAKLQVRSVLQQAFFDESKVGDDAVSVYAANYDSDYYRNAVAQTARQLTRFDSEAFEIRYREIDSQTLIFWGKQDAILAPASGRILNAVMPNSELKMIDQCGHNPHEERVDVFLEELEDFLKS